MSIFINKDTRVITQGITGKTGAFHTEKCQEYANGKACFVAGVNPKKAGESIFHIPIFASVKEAAANTGATVSVIYVPPAGAAAAIWEGIEAELDLVICITEGIPVRDMLEIKHRMAERKSKTLLLGPNCPGLISSEQSNVGIIPADITKKGPIGLVSKSGTLTYQMMYELRDIGFSTAVGIGGDPVIGTTHIDCLRAFQDDPETQAIVMIGEIGGDAEERAAAFIAEYVTKPVVGYVAGFTAPEGKTMGHAGAIVSGSSGTAQAKKDALEAAGVKVGQTPSETAQLMREILGR
jgi:succinyl-CoA synthetase alpha subunit